MDSTSAIRDESTRPTETKSAPSQQTSDVLRQLYGPVAEPLAAVESRLHQELQSPYESLVPLLRHGTQLGGKRLRPAMLLLSASALGQLNDDHVVLGTVIEMVHTATLIHDDVLDEASQRRHVPTINSRWDNHTSILLGDFLFAQSFRLSATLNSTEACRWIGEAARRVCEGELRQVLDRNTIDLDEETYIDILRGKTAELCQVACRLGAVYAGGSEEQIEALAEFGNSMGIAFQIADDYLDLWGDGSAVGKTLGTDIQQGKMTLPIIRLLDVVNETERAQLVSILEGPSDQRVDAIRPWLDACDSREYTWRTAKRYQEAAIAQLGALPESPAKDCLQRIAEFSVNRRF